MSVQAPLSDCAQGPEYQGTVSQLLLLLVLLLSVSVVLTELPIILRSHMYDNFLHGRL